MEQPEQWKESKYKDYWVSDLGRVKHVYKNSEHILTPVVHSKRDKSLRVKINNKYVSLRRLIWETFIGEIPDGYGVVTKDGCRTMNEVYNLKLLSLKECSALNRFSRRKEVIDLDTKTVYASVRLAGEKLFICSTTVSNLCKNKYKTKLYNLEYYDESKNYGRIEKLKYIKCD